MDFLKDVKVYYDGSHYIGIPHVEQPWKKRKATKIKLKNNAERTLPNQQKFESLTQKPKKKDLKTIFNNLYDDLKTKSGTERLETILTEVKKVLPEDMAKEYVKQIMSGKTET